MVHNCHGKENSRQNKESSLLAGTDMIQIKVCFLFFLIIPALGFRIVNCCVFDIWWYVASAVVRRGFYM